MINNSALISKIDKYHSSCLKSEGRVVIALDLAEADDITFSAIMREFKKQENDEAAREFLGLYKQCFDYLIINQVEEPETKALKAALKLYNKLSGNLSKSAQAANSNAEMVGKYLANIIKFTLSRISPERRPKSIQSLKNKIYQLNESALAGKKLPASASMGQAITFVKHVLFNRDAQYIRNVLNYIVSYL